MRRVGIESVPDKFSESADRVACRRDLLQRVMLSFELKNRHLRTRPDFIASASLPRAYWDLPGVYHGCGAMDHSGESLIRLVGTQRDALHLIDFTEAFFDEMSPFVHLLVDLVRRGLARAGIELLRARMLPFEPAMST